MVKLKATKHEARKKAARLQERAKPSGLTKAPPAATGAGELRKKRAERTAQQLVSKLASERAAAAPKRKRSKKGSTTLLGAVASMKDSLEALLDSNETTASTRLPAAPKLSSARGRLKLVTEETDHMKEVISHPAFAADPFAALQEHLENTVHKSEPSADDEMRGREWGDYSGSGGKRGKTSGKRR
jgi:hypothetical protein|tara:strand:- start:127 stop:684 length:558 start_codon:yes stop_codon:yes gene_type:complete